jgi:hypothetical protein
LDRPAKIIGYLLFSDGRLEKKVEVLGVTPRTRAPSLDVRWSISGVYVLRLPTMVLLAIPKDRVRGRDPTPFRCVEPGKAWRLWWDHSCLPTREKKKRCPAAYHLGDCQPEAGSAQ